MASPPSVTISPWWQSRTAPVCRWTWWPALAWSSATFTWSTWPTSGWVHSQTLATFKIWLFSNPSSLATWILCQQTQICFWKIVFFWVNWNTTDIQDAAKKILWTLGNSEQAHTGHGSDWCLPASLLACPIGPRTPLESLECGLKGRTHNILSSRAPVGAKNE